MHLILPPLVMILMNEEVQKSYELIEIIETVAIIFKDGEKKLFDAVQFDRKRGVITGNIVNTEKKDMEEIIKWLKNTKIKKIDSSNIFVETGFIPLTNIDRIELASRKKIIKKKQ